MSTRIYAIFSKETGKFLGEMVVRPGEPMPEVDGADVELSGWY